MERYGIPGHILMERAGQAAFALLRELWPQARHILVCCGPGNNGGDGYVVARLAHAAGLAVQLVELAPERLHGEAASAAARAAVVPRLPFPAALEGCDLIVDALLGTGLSGEVQGGVREAIAAINASGRPVLALDVPSGLDADSGAIRGEAVRATVTLTFIGLKRGLFTGAGSDCCGRVQCDDLALPPTVFDALAPAAERLSLQDYAHWLQPRPRHAHKGQHGHVLVIGGEQGYAGAARLAAEAALRSGAGLVSLATHTAHAPAMAAARPEIMAHGVEDIHQLLPLLQRASVVAIGPGLGQGPWGQHMLGAVLESRRPLVLDADALNLLALEPLRHDAWVLTPHPGEAARLLGEDTAAVEADRFLALAGLQASFGGTVVLKGAGTLVLGPSGRTGLCAGGNPGMACGGMGDVLTGIIAGLMAQGLAPEAAAGLGVCLHAAAGDAAAAEGERGMLASDLLPCLRRLLNPSRRTEGAPGD